MRIVLVFVAGILVGTGIQTIVAQSQRPNLRLNHVALSVKDLPEAVKFYQEKLGFNEVVRNPNGMSARRSHSPTATGRTVTRRPQRLQGPWRK